MNKSPPASGGLFYFGQIAFHEDKQGTISRYMRKVRFLGDFRKAVKPLLISEPEAGDPDDPRPTIKKGRLAQTIPYRWQKKEEVA